MCLFQNRIPGSLYNLKLKVAYKPGLDYLLECFIPSTFARIISVCPKKCKKFPELGGGVGCCPPRPLSPARTPIHGRGKRVKSPTVCW